MNLEPGLHRDSSTRENSTSSRVATTLGGHDARRVADVSSREVSVSALTITPEIQQTAQEIISAGSKSFATAAKIFGTNVKYGAFFLYGWCRYCDDATDNVDQIVGLRADEAMRMKAQRVAELVRKTNSAFDGEPQTESVFHAFQYAVTRFGVPRQYALDLLKGMDLDVHRATYQTFDDLRLYCYYVAGTVGLMMAHIMGVSDPRALDNAAAMGMAMQLTNIARDIREDHEMGRIYLPLDWLKEFGVERSELMDPKNRDQVVQMVARLLDEADRCYAKGKSGLKYLPLRSGWAISSACEIYSYIGRVVRGRGGQAWDRRAFTSFPRKIWLVTYGTFRVLKLVPGRIFKRWAPVSIDGIWRFS
ncbi:MAG: phytoene/squalene synthase family protein [Bacteriovoracia bacterium]